MTTLAVIEHQIHTARTLSSIVGTMRTLAMVNIRRFERTALSLRDYARTQQLALHVATQELPPGQWGDAGAAPGPGLVVLMGSDQGLCGPFNDRLAQNAQAYWSSPQWSALVVGTRLAELLVGSGARISDVLPAPVSIEALTGQARQLLRRIEAHRTAGQCCQLKLVFHRLVSSVRYQASVRDLLPFDSAPFRTLPPGEPPFRTLPQLALPAPQLLLGLLPQYFLSQLALALAESAASENAARLMAMEGASRNIDERLDQLMDQYRQRRQEEITTELADVLAGAEAVQTQ